MQPWFSLWFGEAYKALYPHRDEAEASRQVALIAKAASGQPYWRILDIGCGGGRHLKAFAAHGFSQSVGIDLSPTLLRDARRGELKVARADMRRLPFPPRHFDLIANLFTSFGYFAASAEDFAALEGFASCLKPRGYLFLDLPDRGHVLAHLVPRDESLVHGLQVVQERRIENSGDGLQVIKRIEIRPRPGLPGQGGIFEERVRLYDREQIAVWAQDHGLDLVSAFGDESGGDYKPGFSPRMALLLRKHP